MLIQRMKLGLIVTAIIFIEWLDFSLYLYLSPKIIAPVFFAPSKDSVVFSFLLFAIAYLARPLGGWYFGRKADQHGRKAPMMAAAVLMGLAMIGIACLPGYAVWGAWSTFVLLLLRIAQGIAIGGEINTAALFYVEHRKQKNGLTAGSLSAVCGALGMFVGGILASYLPDNLASNAWRWTFALLGLISFAIALGRRQLPESPEFNGHYMGLKDAWKTYPSALLNIAVIAFYASCLVYICLIFWVSYATKIQLWPAAQVSFVASMAQLSAALVAIMLSFVYQQKHIHHLLRLSALCLIAAALLLFPATQLHVLWGIYLGLLAYVFANAFLTISLYYYLYQQLPAQSRCQAVSFIWAAAASLGAAALPLCQYYANRGRVDLPVLILVMAAITLFYRNASKRALALTH